VKVSNAFGTTFRGTLAKSMTASDWKGIHYIRKYTVPSNPRTPLQVRHRMIFSNGVDAWRDLFNAQQSFYESLAEGMSGYNLFMKRWLEAHTAGEDEFKLPVVFTGSPPDGADLNGCWFILRKGRKTLFLKDLADGPFDIAMSVEDVSYDIVLRRAGVEDIVGTIEDVLEIDVPMTVESEMLGLRVVLDLPEEIRPPEEVLEELE
jgi:hypothetical protein